MTNRGLAGGWYANLAQVVSHIWVSTVAAHLLSSLTHLPTGWPRLLLVTGWKCASPLRSLDSELAPNFFCFLLAKASHKTGLDLREWTNRFLYSMGGVVEAHGKGYIHIYPYIYFHIYMKEKNSINFWESPTLLPCTVGKNQWEHTWRGLVQCLVHRCSVPVNVSLPINTNSKIRHNGDHPLHSAAGGGDRSKTDKLFIHASALLMPLPIGKCF